MMDVIAAEAVKARSVRSTTALVTVCVAAVPIGALMALISAGVWDSATAVERSHFEALGDGTAVLFVVQMCLMAVGILAATTEYTSGMIRTSLTAVPLRREFALAKASVVGALTLVVGTVVSVLVLFASRAIIGDRPIGDLRSLAEGFPVVLAQGLGMAVIALIGLGLGLYIKSTAGTLVTMAVLLFGVPILPWVLLPKPWSGRVVAVLPSQLPNELGGAGITHLSPAGALLAMALWVVLALAIGVSAVKRRDA
ncbi:hypothetical protein JOD54_004830 [Actinokineospora baliensis]|uniref:ABC transporter permease n=1 Tax=Actinokineospora baliensis TaxID=547056 RepID=UPI00195857E8|nr:ABC transporter permease [Actinokineospora baliensis]MBM7774626.1 hypothetical protein [Actinokineospora baliensis]